MNLLIFLDLIYNPGKSVKFYSLQEQNFKIFLIVTYNQGKVFMILPITWGGHMYNWFPLGVAPRSLDAAQLGASQLHNWEENLDKKFFRKQTAKTKRKQSVNWK